MDLPLIIFLALACIAVGAIGWNLVSSLLSSNPDRADETSSASPDPELREVARVYRDRKNEQIVLQMGDQSLRSPLQLKPEQRRVLEAVLSDLIPWVGRTHAEEQPPAGAAAPADVHSFPAPDLDAERLETADPAAPVPARLDGVRILREAIRLGPKKPPLVMKSLALQIDEVLQEMIKDTPLENRGIRLADSPSQGIWVIVGINKYDGVDAVPDLEVRSVIQAAVNEWRKRTNPYGE